MVDVDTKELIQRLDTYQISKRNCMLVYGFLVYMSQKDIDYTKLQSTGRQANAYKLNTKVDTNWIISSLKTISTWTGVCINSVQTSIQYLVNLGVIETKKDLDKQELICKSDTLYLNSISKSKANCIDCLNDLEYKSLYNKIKTDLKMELIEIIRETIDNATNQLKIELEEYIDERLKGIKDEVIQNRQVTIDSANPTNQTNSNWIEKKKERDRVNKSIATFIENIPTLTNEEIDKYVGIYANRLTKCYDKQEFIDNAIQSLKNKVEKARQQHNKDMQPPEWMLKELQPTNSVSVGVYAQLVYEKLKAEEKTDYKGLVDQHKQWFINKVFTDYTPIYKEKYPEYDDIAIYNKIVKAWNSSCYDSKYQLQLKAI